MTKEQFLARERVSSDFFQKAKALKLSEASFSVGGGAAAAHHDGDTEKEFAENYERVFGAEAMKIFEAAREEMKAAHVWPWD